MNERKERILELMDQLREELEEMDAPEMLPPGEQVPMQPLVCERGVIRFRKNKIVAYLLDNGPFDMNQIAMLPDIPREDRAQFAQMIGYSVSGYSDLSYALGVSEASERAHEMYEERNHKSGDPDAKPE